MTATFAARVCRAAFLSEAGGAAHPLCRPLPAMRYIAFGDTGIAFSGLRAG